MASGGLTAPVLLCQSLAAWEKERNSFRFFGKIKPGSWLRDHFYSFVLIFSQLWSLTDLPALPIYFSRPTVGTQRLLPIYFRFTSDLLPVYFRFTSGLLPVYFRFTSGLLPVYFRFE